MNKKLLALAAIAVGGTVAWAAKDAVIMTVNGTDVPLSEFEYLYTKNNQQQLAPQSLDEYVEMFKLYKLKVADAKAEGLDTARSFLRDMRQYKRDLAAPYMADSVYMKNLVKEAYERSKTEAEAQHIMIYKSRDFEQNSKNRNLIDSVRTLILNGADFSEMARLYSQDRTVEKNGGNLGFVTINRFPYSFEKAVFSLSEGELSEIVESPVAYHLIKGGKKRPARGSVLAEHIMVLENDVMGVDQRNAARHKIDSLYQVVVNNPERFEEVAMQYSDDKGSARNGGKLPWFSAGEMVVEFDSLAFSLANGEIGGPVQSQYGWHIIKRLDSRPAPTYDEMYAPMLARITNSQDERARMIMDARNEKLSKKHHAVYNEELVNSILSDAAKYGTTADFFNKWEKAPESEMVLMSVENDHYKVKDLFGKMTHKENSDGAAVRDYVEMLVRGEYNNLLLEAENNVLVKQHPEYRNLLREYEDGSLLYEVSVKKVWDKAAKDTLGLQEYFKAHRNDYKWPDPKVKGYLVQTLNDSVSQLVRSRMQELPEDKMVSTIRKEFAPNVQIERVLVSKGTNAIIDYLMFGGQKTGPSVANFTDVFMVNERLLNAPETVEDVKGLVTSDYQNQLQTYWEDELKSKYPVAINEKVLKKIRKKYK